jgi:hypothetical protein
LLSVRWFFLHSRKAEKKNHEIERIVGQLLFLHLFIHVVLPSVVRLGTIGKNGRHENQNDLFFRVFLSLKDSRSYIVTCLS